MAAFTLSPEVHAQLIADNADIDEVLLEARLATFGWQKQPEDENDYLLQFYRPDIAMKALSLSPMFDLSASPFLTPGGNQLALGSCVYWTTGRAARFAQRKQGLSDYDVSELFGYWEGRNMRGWVDFDSGSYLRDAMEVGRKFGWAEERFWPYGDGVSRFRIKPPQEAYDNAATHQVTRYLKITDGNDDAIDAALESGFPVVFGMPIHQNFPMGNGVFEIPAPFGQIIGGHAMMFVGFDRVRRKRKILNQWGDAWGRNGFAEMSYDHCRSCTDLWIIETMEGEPPPPPPPVIEVVDGVGIWTYDSQGVIRNHHLWPAGPYLEQDETIGGVGVHFLPHADPPSRQVWP